MQSPSRAVLARLAYERALVAARVAPTPRRWRKLLTAATNLRAAEQERERRWLASLTPSVRRLAVVRLAAGRSGPVLLPFPSPGAGPEWTELVRGWERARALMEDSQGLVARAAGPREAVAAESGPRGSRPVVRGVAPPAPKRGRARRGPGTESTRAADVAPRAGVRRGPRLAD